MENRKKKCSHQRLGQDAGHVHDTMHFCPDCKSLINPKTRELVAGHGVVIEREVQA